jgi:hypothetical protein
VRVMVTTATKSSNNMRKTKNKWVPTVRYPESGWKNFAALTYAIVADLVGFQCMLLWASASKFDRMELVVPAILLA